ncbi:MAG: hypothetical protein GW893_18315 [Armatimonadetes bacterium]|nr:hypothetical protein [Armatimonadota bacterium]
MRNEQSDERQSVHPLVCHLYEMSPIDGRGICGIYDDQGMLQVAPVSS